jgi:hypothetical protein
MKSRSPDYYDIPELEETEFALAISRCPHIEDSNDLGEMGDSFSIALSALDAPFDDYDL